MTSRNIYRKSTYIKALSILLLFLFINTPVHSQQIITDGFTNTTLNTVGNITDVTTTTTKGINAFNSFSRFNVDEGNTVNLVVPNASTNLINIVKNEITNINGVLNSYQNGQIGGNVFLVNPHGIIIGQPGVVNVGSLTAVTPTQEFVNGFFDAPGNPNDAAVTALLNGDAPIKPDAIIQNAGHINGYQKLELKGGQIDNSGTIELSNIVNVDKLQNGQVIGSFNGEIFITAEDGLFNTGTVKADGTDNVDGGTIAFVNAGEENGLFFSETSVVSAKGVSTNSAGGQIVLASPFIAIGDEQMAQFDVSSPVAAGSILINSPDTVQIINTLMNTGSIAGQQGAVMAIGNNVEIVNKLYTCGGSLMIAADQVCANCGDAVISTRNVANPIIVDHLTAPSIGPSGAIQINGESAVLLQGGEQGTPLYLLAQGDNGFVGGDIDLHSQELLIGANTNVITSTNIVLAGDDVLAVSGWLPPGDMFPGPIINVPTGTLTINSANVTFFNPEGVDVQSIESDFLHQNGPLDLLNKDQVLLGNLDNVLVNGSLLKPNNVTVQAENYIGFTGTSKITGDLLLQSNSNIEFNNALVNAKSITTNSTADTTIVNSQLTAGFDTFLLEVTEDGKIHPDSTLNASIQGNTINVSPINFNNGNISITTPNLLGNLSDLTVYNGNQVIEIINSSNLNLSLQSIDTPTITGEILFNGNKVTNPIPTPDGIINVTYVNSELDFPMINIGSEGTGNVIINNDITNPTGLINFGANGNITSNLAGPVPTISGGIVGIISDQGEIKNLNFDNGGITTLTSRGDMVVTGRTGVLAIDTMGNATYSNINAASIDATSTQNITLNTGNIAGYLKINTDGKTELFNLNIGDNLESNANSFLYTQGEVAKDAIIVTQNDAQLGTSDLVTIKGNGDINSANGKVIYYQGQVDGNLSVVAKGKINVGTNTALLAVNDQAGRVKPFVIIDGVDYTDPVDKKATTIGGDLFINSSNDVDYEGSTNGIITVRGINVKLKEKDDTNIEVIYGQSDVTIISENGNINNIDNTEPSIYCNDLSLITNNNGSMGLNNYPLNISITGTLSALGTGGIYIYQSSEDMNLFVASTAGQNNVNLVANGNILNASPNNATNIYGGNINLVSNYGAIGDPEDPININLNYALIGGVLNAWANDEIAINHNTNRTNLEINTIQSLESDVNLSSNCGIINVSPNNTTTNITGNNITLNAINGSSIGTYSSSINLHLNGGQLTAFGYGYMNLVTDTDMPINVISNAGRGFITLTSQNGSILDASPTELANIYSNGLNLIATNAGTIGIAGNDLNIDTNYNSVGGKVLAFARNYININEVAGDLNLDVVSNAGRADVMVSANGGILNNAVAGSHYNIYGRGITLNSANGNIGMPTNQLGIMLNYNGDPDAGKFVAAANNGMINVYQPFGNLVLTTVNAGSDVILTSGGGLYTKTTLPVINITGNNLTLNSAIAVGTISNPIEVWCYGRIKVNAPSKYVHRNL